MCPDSVAVGADNIALGNLFENDALRTSSFKLPDLMKFPLSGPVVEVHHIRWKLLFAVSAWFVFSRMNEVAEPNLSLVYAAYNGGAVL